MKFIANYINRRNAYTTYKNHTSIQRQFKTGVSQCGVLSPSLFIIYTAELPPLRAPVQVMAYADDITITSTHTSTSAANKYIQPYLHKVYVWTKHNKLAKSRQNNLRSVHSRPCGICPWQRNQRFWALPYTQNSHTAHTFTTSQYAYTNLYKS